MAEITKMRDHLRENLARVEGQKVAVVGDVGLDEYLTGDVRRISPEAPVPVVEVKDRGFRVGLAANVAQNIHSLGGSSILVGLVGKDDSAQTLQSLLKSSGVPAQHLVVDELRPTTRKVRVMSGQHHVVRVDFEEKKFLSKKNEEDFIRVIESQIGDCIGLILQDYGKGVLSENLCQKIIGICKKKNKKVVVDPHRTTPISYYRGADLIKPNRDEAFILSGLNVDDLHLDDKTLTRVGRAIQEKANCKNLIITQGKDGVTFFQDEKMTTIPTLPRQVYDVTGAGDTYLAAFCLAWFADFDPIAAAVMANYAAGVVVGKIGSVPCSKAELLEAMG